MEGETPVPVKYHYPHYLPTSLQHLYAIPLYARPLISMSYTVSLQYHTYQMPIMLILVIYSPKKPWRFPICRPAGRHSYKKAWPMAEKLKVLILL